MNAHLAEVIAKAGLEEGTHGFRQMLAAALQCMDAEFNFRRNAGSAAAYLLGLDGHVLLAPMTFFDPLKIFMCTFLGNMGRRIASFL